jgi:hypothetical protein
VTNVTWRLARLLGATRVVELHPGVPVNLFVLDNDLAMTRRFIDDQDVDAK